MAMRQTYVVWAPADTKPEVLERRTAVLRDHLKNIARLAKEGTLSVCFVSFRRTKYLLNNNNRAGRTDGRARIG
jgi:hypothetical protein